MSAITGGVPPGARRASDRPDVAALVSSSPSEALGGLFTKLLGGTSCALMGAMRIFAPATSLAAALLVVASASAGEPPPSPSIPAPAAAPAAAPPVDVTAPAVAAPPSQPASAPSGPGYVAPYAVYAAPGPGAPPPFWMGRPPVTERRSNSMRIMGIGLLSIGGMVSVTGATLIGLGFQCFSDSTPIPLDAPAPAPAPASARGQGGGERIGSARQALNACKLTGPGVGLLIGGLVGAVAGIPLLVIGSQRVPAGPMKGAILPAVTVGAGSASLRWTF